MYSDGKTLPPHWQNLVMMKVPDTSTRSKHYDKKTARADGLSECRVSSGDDIFCETWAVDGVVGVFDW